MRDEQQDTLVSLSGSKRGAPAAWWHGYMDVLSDTFHEYLAAEDNASQILTYSPCLVPGLLQSEDYAFALATADEQVPSGLEAHVAQASRARQEAVLASGRANISIVIGEAALRQQIGDAGLMRGQLERIIELIADSSWATVQVVPFAAGPYGIVSCCSLSVLRFPALPTLGMVYITGPNGGICLEQPQDVGAYVQAFQHAQASALSSEASLEFIQRVAAE